MHHNQLYFGEFKPAEGFFVELILQEREAFALLRQFVDGEGAAAEGFFQLALLRLEGRDLFFQTLELGLLLVCKFSFRGER